VASDAVPSNQDGPPGPHTWKQDISYYRGSFSDLTYTVDDLISAGDKVVARWTARGTDSIGFMGMPPSDMSVTFTGVTIYRFVDGKIVEHWAEFDLAGLLHRLGVATIRRDLGTA
jgi:predicted ester cyclase